MRVSHTATFEATPDEVHAMLTGPGFRGLVAERGATTQHFEGELTVKVPLTKDKPERLMAQLYVEWRDREQGEGGRR